MDESTKKIVKVGARLAGFIGSKATREKKLQAAAMHAEFSLRDTLIVLSYLSRDPDKEISSQARKNLIPAVRNWYTRPDKPELPEPIYEIVRKVIERVGLGEAADSDEDRLGTVEGNIGLFGLGEIIQAVDHNNRTASIKLVRNGESVTVYTENGKVVGAVTDKEDGMEALYKAFGWGEAQFIYSHSPPGRFENRIRANTLNLVMDALEHAPDTDPFSGESSWSWKVEGHLKVMNIFEVAEIFEMNSRYAVCSLTTADQDGKLYFGGGRIINASMGTMTGMDAACYLLAWPSARFVIARGGEDVPDVIHVGMQNLIIEAMRLLDEGVTVTDRIASELAQLDELFEGKDVFLLPILDKVRLVFGEDAQAREELETDSNPVVRKAVKVKISKTVHKYLKVTTDHKVRLSAAKARVPTSTTEKLVLLSYLSHDENEEIREAAKTTLEGLDVKTYRKGFDSDLHPSVTDYLVREAIRDTSLIRAACGTTGLLPETALYIMEQWRDEETLRALLDNSRLLERSDAVVRQLYEFAAEYPHIRRRVDSFEEGLLAGEGTVKVEGYLSFCGLSGLIRAAQSSSRSGTIALEEQHSAGRVYFAKGKVVGATWDSLEGSAALEEILKHTGLKFRYVLHTHFHQENIDPIEAEKILNRREAGPTAYKPEEGESGFRIISGHPEAMDIYELLTTLETTPVPVRINVVCDEGWGNIYRDGLHVLHAEVRGKPTAHESMAAILSWTGTKFLVRDIDQPVSRTVQKTVMEFFAECVSLAGEEAQRTARPGELPEWELSEEEYNNLYHKIMHMGVADKVKLAFFGSKEARDMLVRDAVKLVALAAVRSPKIQESEIDAISKSRNVCDEVLRHIASTKEWVGSYNIRVNLCNNSKTPLPVAMKLLNQLRVTELRKLSKSKNVPQALANQARRLAEAKGDRY